MNSLSRLAPSFEAGLSNIRRRPGLVFLVYALNLLPAFLLAVPLYAVLAAHVGPTGFGDDLARAFDLTLWADILEEAAGRFVAVGAPLLWAAPAYLIWKAALAAGLIHALRGPGRHSFWRGVARYTVRTAGLALLFLPLLLAWLVFTMATAALLGDLWPGEVGAFWTYGFVAPLLFSAGLLLTDLMQDYGRIALILEERPVRRAWRAGLRWPFVYGRSVGLYLAWFGIAVVLLALPTFLEMRFTAASPFTLWSLFLLQQAVLLLRAAATVGWIGSEVAFFAAVRPPDVPPAAAPDPFQTTETVGEAGAADRRAWETGEAGR